MVSVTHPLLLPLLLVLLYGAVATSYPAQVANPDDIRSAVAMSQLILAQQAQFFRELINITKNSNNCCNRFKADFDFDGGNGDGCPYPYSRVVNECYYLSQQALPWHSARHSCRGMSGDLATPSHLYALKAFLNDQRSSRSVWIGGQDNGLDGGWRWVDGRPVDSADWAKQQPDERRAVEQCLALRRDRHPVLHDSACHSGQRYVCQYIQ
ncbi:hypothetical protein Pcinc_021094 [Petrolisthes cinctipes]|uniref:C-type lectin domain-containing protein n=1 Tax=Petrolisthes cinctipes TaxID=88211 RepID=A0AAE1KIX6_PETCI|nr:hypothetical protein Pcinc_021094 [Petrolisthes cinctipes]